MAVVKDVKKQPKDEAHLQMYSGYGLILCLIVSLIMALWYMIRLNLSGKNPSEPSWFWSSVHLVAYIAYAVVTTFGLLGTYYPRPQFMQWYLIGTLVVIFFEMGCLFSNLVIVADQNKKFAFFSIFFKVIALLVFIVCSVLAYLWKSYLDKLDKQKKPKAVANKATTTTTTTDSE